MKRIFRIIVSISFSGISFIGLVFLVWPEYQEYSSLKAQVASREARLESGDRTLTQLKKLQEEVVLHQEDFAKIDVAIPKDAGLPVLYEHIQQLGASSGLILFSIGGQPAIESVGEVGVLVFTAQLGGSYEGLKNFLDALKKSARIFNVSTLNVSTVAVSAESEDSADGENPGELTIDIELLAYELPK